MLTDQNWLEHPKTIRLLQLVNKLRDVASSAIGNPCADKENGWKLVMRYTGEALGEKPDSIRKWIPDRAQNIDEAIIVRPGGYPLEWVEDDDGYRMLVTYVEIATYDENHVIAIEEHKDHSISVTAYNEDGVIGAFSTGLCREPEPV